MSQDREEYDGLHPSHADEWMRKELALGLKNAMDAFSGCSRLSLSGDPSDYMGEDTLVSVAYRPDTNLACTPPIQVGMSQRDVD